MDLTKLKLVDLTHGLNANIPHWDLDCGFKCQTVTDYDECETLTKFKVQQLQMVSGIGTHMDAPSHCIRDGLSIADIPLAHLIRPCVVIDVSPKVHENYQVTINDIEEFEAKFKQIANGTLVIIHTGWSQYWHSPKYRNDLHFPSVSAPAAQLLVKRGISGLGIDTLSPDAGASGFPVHQILLANNCYIIENITNSDKLPATGAYIFALPLKIEHGTEAPIRLVGIFGKDLINQTIIEESNVIHK
jgi:kynurenine formamidase